MQWAATIKTSVCFAACKKHATGGAYAGIMAARSADSTKLAASNEYFGFGLSGDVAKLTGNFGRADNTMCRVNGVSQSLTNYNDYITGVNHNIAAFSLLVHGQPSVSGAKNVVIGADVYSGGRFLPLDAAEFLIFEETLTIEQISAVERYLNAKWAIY